MSRTPARAVLAAFAAGLGLTLAAAPALAGGVNVIDADNDVANLYAGTLTYGDFDQDLRSILVDHTATNLNVTSTFSVLGANSWTDTFLNIDTNLDGVEDYTAIWTRDTDVSTPELTPSTTVSPVIPGTDNLGPATCTSFSIAEVPGAPGKTVFSIPRSCFGNAASVRVHLDVWFFGVDDAGNDDTYVDAAPDAAGTAGPVFTTFTAPIASGTAVVVPSPAAPQVSSSVVVKASKKTQKVGGTPVRLTIRSAVGAGGVVKVRDGRKTLKTLAVGAGQAVAYKLPRRLKAGLHRITVTFVPTGAAKFAVSKKTVKIRVRR